MYEKIDPVTLEVIYHRLVSIADEMEDALLKSSFSVIVKEARDATTAIFDAKGRNVAQTVAILLIFPRPDDMLVWHCIHLLPLEICRASSRVTSFLEPTPPSAWI